MQSNSTTENFVESPTVYRLSDDKYKSLGIPKVCPINDHEEVWAYCKFDRHPELTEKKRYIVSNYGRVYDTKQHVILKSYGTVYESKHRYRYQSVSVQHRCGNKRCIQYLCIDWLLCRSILLTNTDRLLITKMVVLSIIIFGI